ncbi:hypothetical protein KP509_22G077500 [Ceratopteris richardii]|nr:hypothetical protein KP509_22G077500 [Ceratopteris richardii]KAH7307784.1 hypothetical protein KP509_22G077500 [Ceratopteris richardii]KAH7307785.1 hypothetical protein KP509_22G077500 [Ceratopteris richardii]
MQAIGEQNLLSLNEEPKRVGLKHTACNNEVHPNAHIIDVIKSCAARKDLHQAYKIHSDLADRGLLQTDISFGNALISMYSKCGDLSAAEELFEKLPARNVITWNSLISGYVQSGLGYDALNSFSRMQDLGIIPSSVTFVCALKACSLLKSVEKGEELHAEIIRHGMLERHEMLGTALVDMYAKCRMLSKAQAVFDALKRRDVVTWNALITGYTQFGKAKDALRCYKLMQNEGVSPSAVTFICILKACGSMGALKEGREIHVEINRQGLLDSDIVVGNALLDMYAKCGCLDLAQQVFEELPKQDVTTWNALITGYVHHGFADDALRCYAYMQKRGFTPDAITFICILKACGSLKAIGRGEEIRHDIERQGLLGKDIKVGNALVDMYAKCGALEKARGVLKNLPARNVITWTALIAGYAEYGYGGEALCCFAEMKEEGHSANSVTLICVLKACGNMQALKMGEEVHETIKDQGLLENDVVLGTALVDMYAKCGVLAKAQAVFDMLPVRNTVTWNALIAGYIQHGADDEALLWFSCMLDEGALPDEVTYINVLKACGNLGSAKKGKEIHDELDRRHVEDNLDVGNALVDFYVKCGDLEKAKEIFKRLSVRNVATWTALVCGYSQVGKINMAFSSFHKMIEEDVEPNEVTFMVLLTACSHEGLIEKGESLFHIMCTYYGISPNLEHYTCMVDIFSRAGLFGTALTLIGQVPPSDSLLLWSAFMGACREWKNVALARWAFEHAVGVDEKFAAAYLCMSNTPLSTALHDEEDYEL